MEYEDELKKEVAELHEVKLMIQKAVFQKWFVDPLKQSIDDMKPAYNCKTLTDLHYLRGRKEGLDAFFDILRGIETAYQLKKRELDNI